MELLSHPFRLRPNGEVATVEQGSDEANAEQLAVLVLTRIGERELAGGFGITDPTFAGLAPSEVAAGVAAFGPDIDIDTIEVEPVDDATLNVAIRFS